VYKGEYNQTDVAIKKIHDKLISQQDLEAFQEEAKLMGELPPHPNGRIRNHFSFQISCNQFIYK
jgi:hypothetical protein